MHQPVLVELNAYLKGELGARALTGRLPRVLEALRWVAADGRSWPTQSPVATVDEAALAVLRKGAKLRVVGPHGAVSALRALVAAVVPEANIRWQTHHSDEPAAAREGIFCIEGPAWVDDLAEGAVQANIRVVVAGSGAHDAPPRGAWLDDALVRDGRFVGLSRSWLTILEWAGGAERGASQRWAEGVTDGQGTCSRPALLENPGWALAAALSLRPEALPVFIATTPELELLVRSFARTWSATVRGRPVGREPSARVGMAVTDGLAGDELVFESLCGAPEDRLPVFFGPSTAAATTLQAWLTREGRPHLGVRCGLDDRALGALVTVSTHAALSLAVLHHLDPLDTPGADAWLRALDRSLASTTA